MITKPCPHCKTPVEFMMSDAAAVMGSVRKTSEKLKNAARENGKKGGRPKKKVVVYQFEI